MSSLENTSTEGLRDLLRRDVVAAAPALLDAILEWGPLRARIVETEAYRGEDDPACHAYGRPKMRNMVLYGEPGFAYVYLNYGMHWMLNVSAHEPGRAAGILIRAAEPLAGLEIMRANRQGARPRHLNDTDLLSGPGKLAQAFAITSAQNGVDLLAADGLHLITSPTPTAFLTAPRVGIAEGKWHETPWRFLDATRLRWTSLPRPSPGQGRTG